MQAIPGSASAAVSALAWLQDASTGQWALISGGLDGQLRVCDFEALACSDSIDSYGGAVWALAANPGDHSPHPTHGSKSRLLGSAVCNCDAPHGAYTLLQDQDLCRHWSKPEVTRLAPAEASLSAAGSTRLAAGLDDGSVRFFTWSAAEGLQYQRRGPQAPGRVLSLAWHPSGSILVGGSSQGTVHAWEAATGQEALCIELGRA